MVTMANIILIYIVLAVFQLKYISPAPAVIGPETGLKQQPITCSSCPPGYGVVRQCSQSEDTLCQPCKEGYHSSKSSDVEACHPCSRCGYELFEIHPCDPTRDVFCGLCGMPGVMVNHDYVRKCSKLPVKTLNELNSKYSKYKKPGKTLEIQGMVGDDPQAAVITENKNGGNEIKEDSNPSKLGDKEEIPDFSPKPDLPIDSEDALVTGVDQIKVHTDVASIDNQASTPGQGIVSDNKPNEESPVENKNQETDSKLHESVSQANNHENPENHEDETTSLDGIMELVDTNEDVTDGIKEAGDADELLQNNGSKVIVLTKNVNQTEIHEKMISSTEAPIIDEEASGEGPILKYHTESPKEEEVSHSEEEIPSEVLKTEVKDRSSTASTRVDKIKEVTKSQTVTPHLEEQSENKTGIDPVAFGVPYPGDDDVEIQATTKHEGVGAAPIIIMVFTCAIVFFLLGFYYHRYHGNKMQMYTPSRLTNSYQLAPTKPAYGDEDDYVVKKKTPQIICTSDEVEMKSVTPLLSEKPTEKAAEKPAEKPKEKPKPPLAGNTGKHQSPIDITPGDAVFDDDLAKVPLVMNYVPENTKSLINTGTTVKVTIDCRGSDLHGGPLGDTRYCLDHFHFHWGTEDRKGSEHTVSGSGYAAELHLVHWNKELFKNFNEAAQYETGLCVIGAFLEASNEEHQGMQALIDVFNSIRYKGESCEVPHHFFDPRCLLPARSTEYWTYPGSLTVPPYHESVRWILMKHPIKVSQRQLAQFRDLRKYAKGGSISPTEDEERYIRDNYRCTMKLGDRVLQASFR